VAPRRSLDAALVAAAAHAGARLAQGTTVEAMEGAFGERVAATLSSGATVHATFVVAADGAWSPTRRLLGDRVDRVRSDWLAFRQYTAWDGPADTIHVAFEQDLLPTYFWSFPLGDGTANVGFGLHVGAVAPLGALGERWRQLLARDHLARFVAGGATDRLRAWPIPAHVDRVRLAAGRVLYAGDAAAACDALTGEGIGQALETGRLAARSIVDAGTDPGAAGRAHTRRVRASLLADHRLSIAMMRLVADRRLTNLGVAAFGWGRGVGTLLGRWMFEDFPRHRIVAPSSWSNRRCGAYSTAEVDGAAG
jgi:flavin-dependent dehydrogenase